MIRRLDNRYHSKVMEYLNKEPEFNIFIMGDIERYGYDNYFLNIWANISENGDIEGILLKYFEFLIFYSYERYEVNEFARFINRLNYCEISGKTENLEQLASRLDIQKKRTVKLCNLDNQNKLNSSDISNVKIKQIRFGNINKIVKLYYDIEEFENTTGYSIKNVLKSGRGYCIEIDRKVIAMAKSTSENKTHAMIVGVGTHPNYRNKGYATKCLIKISKELLDENKIPCLFYDNEEAGKLYKKLGFKELGSWSIYYK